jgi:hypothetical protein
MIKKLLTILGIIGLFLCSGANAASTCQDVTQQFYDYNKGLPNTAMNVFPYSWQDMSWLLAKLGPPAQTNNYTQTIAIWSKYSYSLIAEDGKVTSAVGQKPQLLANYLGDPSIEDANRELGPPDDLQTGNLVNASWACDTHSNLTIISNQTQNQAIVGFKGSYCPESDPSHCQNFSNYHASFPNYQNIGVGFQQAGLYIQHPPLQPQYTDAQAVTLANQQTLQMINTQLHANVQTATEMQTFVLKTVANYYTNLRSCTPGVYIYARPFILGGHLISDTEIAPFFYLVSTKIMGMTDNKCVIETSAKIGKNTGSMTCKYSLQDLALFTDTKAAMDATYPSNFDVNQVAQTKALLKSCQIYFNGALLTGT